VEEVQEKGKAKQEVEEEAPVVIKKRKVIFSKSYGNQGGANTVCLREFEGISCEGGVLIEGFPSVSLTSILSASFLVDQLKLPLVGFISSTDFPPKCVIDKGQPSHPIRIFGDRRLVVILCEFKLPSNEITYNVVDAMLDFAFRHSCKMVITVEGLPMENFEKGKGEEDRLRYISSNETFNEKMREKGYTAVKEGVIAGVTGVILAEGPIRDVDVGCLLAPTSAQFPDARSSVNIINALKSFLVDVEIDTTPLEEKAAQLERSVKGVIAQANRPSSSQMYG